MELLFLFKRAMKKIQVSFILFIFLILEKRVSMELKIKKNTKLTAEALVGVAVSKSYILKGTQDYILYTSTKYIFLLNVYAQFYCYWFQRSMAAGILLPILQWKQRRSNRA